MSEQRRHDYIPANAAQFNVFLRNIVQYVQARAIGPAAAWPNIPSERVVQLTEAHAVFLMTLNTAAAAPTHANILARKEMQTEAARILRAFVNQYLRFPPVTNIDRAEMGIPNHDTIRTDHTIVTEKVDFVIHLHTIRELAIDFWIAGSSHKAKPHGYDGAVIIWGIRDTPPESPDDLIHHTMASRTPFTLHFEEAERGKTVYVGLAWQNERGITGEWSAFKSAIVP